MRPSESSVGSSGETSRMRIEMFSPCRVGTEARRRSTALPSLVSKEVRPSWGMRRSAMSMLPMILMRLTMPAWTSAGNSRSLCSTPSMRQRTCSASACGSTWMSEAFMLTASEMRPSTISMIEASCARAASSATSDSSSLAQLAQLAPRVEEGGAGLVERGLGADDGAHVALGAQPDLVDGDDVEGVGHRQHQGPVVLQLEREDAPVDHEPTRPHPGRAAARRCGDWGSRGLRSWRPQFGPPPACRNSQHCLRLNPLEANRPRRPCRNSI